MASPRHPLAFIIHPIWLHGRVQSNAAFCPPDQRRDPCDYLFRAKGFGNIIVCTAIKAHQYIALLDPRRQHQYRHRAEFPDRTADGYAVTGRQHQVEDDGTWRI